MFFSHFRLMDGTNRMNELKRFHELIERFIGEGLLEFDGSTLRLTNQGVMLSNEVFAEFIS